LEIKSLKEFKVLIKACRSLGINTIEVGTLKCTLGHLPLKADKGPNIDTTAFPEASIKVPQYNGPIADVEPIKTEDLSEEQLMFYSAQSHEQVEQ
jgi:hypothetical protein